MRYDINPLTPAGISLAVGKYRSRREYRKSRKGFISLRTCFIAGALKSVFLCAPRVFEGISLEATRR